MPQPKKQVECICEYCGKSFSVSACFAKNRRYCTWECRVAAGNDTKAETTCQNCGKPFQTYKKNPQKYCSISCGVSARNRTDLNPSKHRDITGENNPMFGKGHLTSGERNGMYNRRGADSPNWKGGRKIRADGYILIYAPNHPFAISDGAGGKIYILEHRLIMERHLGRYLDSDEVIHHIDGNPSNNAIENLRLYASQSEHISDGHGSSADESSSS
jgi:hypothetical protein